MQPATSLFLDFLRFFAACVVFLHHVTSRDFNQVLPYVRWGHEAVVVFFVLSGFVIAHVVSSRERIVSQFAAARLGRLYSVVLPALMLTALLDPLGRSLSPELYASIPGDHASLRLLINFVFLQENWNLTTMPLSNGPFWSLGFEFWYYLIFGAAVLTHGRMRIALPLLFCACAGPRIVAFLPIWLLGVLAYRFYSLWNPTLRVKRLLLLINAMALVSILSFGNPLSPVRNELHSMFPDNYLDMGFVRIFLGDIPLLPEDLLLGALIGLLIITIRGAIPRGVAFEGMANSVRYLAGATFSVYLFHVPLLYFMSAWLNLDRTSVLEVGSMALMVFVCCIFLSYLGERQVAHYRKFFLYLFDRINAMRSWRKGGMVSVR